MVAVLVACPHLRANCVESSRVLKENPIDQIDLQMFCFTDPFAPTDLDRVTCYAQF